VDFELVVGLYYCSECFVGVFVEVVFWCVDNGDLYGFGVVCCGYGLFFVVLFGMSVVNWGDGLDSGCIKVL